MQHDHGYFEDEQLGHIGDIKLWHRILGFILPQWRWVGTAVLLSLIIIATSLALPRLIQIAIDSYIINENL
jgi:ATP-binding cassette subfamily B protein